jgi:hypothetical protein
MLRMRTVILRALDGTSALGLSARAGTLTVRRKLRARSFLKVLFMASTSGSRGDATFS